MDRLRDFINHFWPWPSRTPQLIATTGSGPQRTRCEKRGAPLRRRQPFRPVNALGPLYLDLFGRMHRCYEQLRISETFWEEVQQDRRYFHGVADYRTCELDRLRDDDRADFTAISEAMAAAKVRAESDHDDLKARLDEHQPSFKRVSGRIIDIWDQVYQHGQAYLDRCLDVSFGEDWSLSHQECIAMRPLIDMHLVLQQRKGAVRQLQYDSIAARANPGGISQEIEDQIETLKDKVEMTQKNQDEAQREFVTTHLNEMLRRAGVIEESQEEDDDDQQHQQQYETEEEGETHLHSERDFEDHDSTDNYDSPADYALAKFYQTRNTHEALQAKVSRRQQELLASETQHLLTFPKSSITRFRLLVDRLTADDIAEMQEAETAWIEAYQDLLELGIPIPQTPEHSLDKPPTGGGLDEDDAEVIMISDSGQRRKRRRLNRVRAGIVQDADPGRSPSLPRSRDLSNLRSDSQGWERRTASLSPSTRVERKRRLRDYEAEMEDEWETV